MLDTSLLLGYCSLFKYCTLNGKYVYLFTDCCHEMKTGTGTLAPVNLRNIHETIIDVFKITSVVVIVLFYYE